MRRSERWRRTLEVEPTLSFSTRRLPPARPAPAEESVVLGPPSRLKMMAGELLELERSVMEAR
jgi:hypothetical protein